MLKADQVQAASRPRITHVGTRAILGTQHMNILLSKQYHITIVLNIHICIYIYIQIDTLNACVCMYIYIYICNR